MPLRACPAAMEESPAKRVRITAPAQGDDEDWFGAVPNDVILHIMSFLTTRQAVRTCVLSRRWLNLWRSVPCIQADISEFQRRDSEWEEYDRERESAFKMLIERVLELRDPAASIRTFRFRCCRLDGFEDTSDSEDINRWISHAVQKQAWVLDIVVLYDALKLDHSAFTSSYLTRIEFTNILMMQGFFKQLETGCPALENLFLDECNVVDVEISSQTLKLRIENNLQWYPRFNNLVSLTLGQWCLDANFYGLIVFLKNSPKLEKLTLELEKETPQRIIGELEERSFTCEHLTSVEVVCSEDDPLVNDVVEFFVNSGLTSAQVHIIHWS
ncbi:hypothetical protein E2562_008789 [Oryza meyeriana var. granulata]|uniref:F-box domain-containing protein n=1 Tax=Oryza meyeriana var. granulata TaxID=110450 RepID=A0A6G1CZZ3_9ORYZ|nr:hypothetical protein E2562_008789 [Oryza meyeriana var. granulata]